MEALKQSNGFLIYSGRVYVSICITWIDGQINIDIDMDRKGNSKEEIIAKTGLSEDEVEAIYTYYKK